jgi:hypothetical protein
MFTFPAMDTKTIVLLLALLSAVILGAIFGTPCYKEGLTTDDETPKPAKSKTVYETSMDMDNDGNNLGEPLPFEEGSILADSIEKCKEACTKFGESCVGFTQDLKQCTLKSSKGTDTEAKAKGINGFWKA